MNKELVKAGEFAAALNVRPENRPDLVMLSSCQTAQGTVHEEFRGVANRLLESGVPAVIAMGFSILDMFATRFSAAFYKQLAEREHLSGAFLAGIRHILGLEAQLRQHQTDRLPTQWMIPQLYTTRQIIHFVNWDAAEKTLTYGSEKFVTGKERLILQIQDGYQFIGRRRERKEAITCLLSKEPVLLKGQGGVGKTALAEHLATLLMVHDPRVQPFVVNETRPSLETLIDAILSYLETQSRQFTIRGRAATYEKEMDRFLFLLEALDNVCLPLFLFDNLETFQESKGGRFRLEHADILEAIQFVSRNQTFHVIFTSRYPLEDFPTVATVAQLSPVLCETGLFSAILGRFQISINL